jgi:hypothetical protein
MVKYSSLYKIVRKRNMSVAQVLSTTLLNVSFRRALVRDSWDKWLELVGNVLMVNLNDRNDSFIWTANKNFPVRNMYNDIVLREGTLVNCWAWNAKIPLKIKIFLWYLRNGVVLTKNNLVKRHWKGCTKCCFCAEKHGEVCVLRLGLKNRREWSIFFVLGLEVFRVSKGTLC